MGVRGCARVSEFCGRGGGLEMNTLPPCHRKGGVDDMVCQQNSYLFVCLDGLVGWLNWWVEPKKKKKKKKPSPWKGVPPTFGVFVCAEGT